MMVSLRHRLVVLAMPKCASTALEAALAPHMDVVIGGVPSAKHTPYRKYNRFLKKYFEGFTTGPLETVCLFREPLDWLSSWWRYRGRSKIPDKSRSTKNMSFDDFVQRYLDGAKPPADVGQQSRFISNAEGMPSVDHLFRYDEVRSMVRFISERMSIETDLPRVNVSPAAHMDAKLEPNTEGALRQHLSLDFEIYEGLSAGVVP